MGDVVAEDREFGDYEEDCVDFVSEADFLLVERRGGGGEEEG